MSAKIKDVAKKAGVSIATVSRVINNVPLVNPQTKEKVLQAVKETGYRPNAIARSLKLQKTDTIGVLIYDITKPYYTQISRGIQDILSMEGYNILLCNGDSNQQKEEDAMDLFFQKQCDGIIYIGKFFPDNIRQKLDYMNTPTVICSSKDETGTYPSVVNSDYDSSYEMVKYINDLGHKKIGFINAKEDKSYCAKMRGSGIETALKELKINKNEDWFAYGDYTMYSGYECAKIILSKKEKPSVIICGNDEMAIGAKKAIVEEGLNVPDDISLVGLNSLEMGRWAVPSITSVNNYMYDLGAVSARMLSKMISKEVVVEKEVIISHEIVEGESVKKIK